MAVFAIMVRVEYGDDYSDRYSKITDTIRNEAIGGLCWEEPTSAYILESTKTATELANAIYIGSPLNTSRDTLVVINLSTKGVGSYAEWGVKYPHTLKSLMGAR